MGLLSGVVFGVLRMLLALHPYAALHWPTRKIAAGGALIVAAGYLALSGGNVATQRAFVMAAVALCAIMLGRRAISLRSVAMAATIVLVLRPEALMGPGFQMSFAATTALVAVFGWIRGSPLAGGPAWLKPITAVVVSSAVAGIATAPIGAAHFNAISQYGLIANLSSVPLMGVLVIPAALFALVLSPFGLEGIGLWFMGLGLKWTLWVAQTVAGWDGSRLYVHGPGGWVLPLLAGGFLVLVLWQGRLKWTGLAMMGASALIWQATPRPTILIADTGAIVGVMTDRGRALSKPKGAGFIARNWLENDGDASAQDQAARRWKGAQQQAGGAQILHVSGKRAAAKLTGCNGADVIVASAPLSWAKNRTSPERNTINGCRIYDPAKLEHTGAVALYLLDGVWHEKTARQSVGARLWTHWPDP